MNYKKWLQQNTTSLFGKTVAITGSTGGLGKEICFWLAGLGANLVLIDRNKQKQDNLKTQLLQKFSSIKVNGFIVDNENFESVKKVCEKLKQININTIIFNAGAYKIPRTKTSLGYDNIFQINFISAYYMLCELLPVLDKKEDAKVVIVGSIAHKKNRFNASDIDFFNCKKSTRVYGNAKRFLMFSAIQKIKQYKNVKLAIVHPGITLTNIISNFPKVIYTIVKPIMKIVFDSPKKASLNILKGVFDSTKNTEWIGPKFCDIWGKPKKKILKTYNEQEAKLMFNQAENICKNLK